MGRGTPTPLPMHAKIRAHSGGEISDSLFATVYVDDLLQHGTALRLQKGPVLFRSLRLTDLLVGSSRSALVQ